jgi:hypothetical protein
VNAKVLSVICRSDSLSDVPTANVHLALVEIDVARLKVRHLDAIGRARITARSTAFFSSRTLPGQR